MFIGEGHNVRTHPVIKVLRSFFKSDPPVILRPQACGALRALARWFISLAPPLSRERTLWLKLTFRKSIPLSLLLGVCRFFFVKGGAEEKKWCFAQLPYQKETPGAAARGGRFLKKAPQKLLIFGKCEHSAPHR